MVTIFEAKRGTIKIDAAADITISASTVLDTAFASATAITGQVKSIDIDTGVPDVEPVDLIGTTSSFQNMELEEKPAKIVTVSLTVVLPGDEVSESEIFGSGTAAGGTHTTYRTGLATRTKLAWMYNLDDGTDEVNFAGTNARLAEEWTLKHTADGHAEVTFKLKCKPTDFYGPQFKD